MSYANARTPIYGLAMMQDEMLTRGVVFRRCVAWIVDLFLVAILTSVAWVVLFIFGLLTLGLGMPLLGLLSFVPGLYCFLFLAGMAATPGQALLGLRVLRDDDLGRPTPLQALASVVVYTLTWATSGLLLLVALFTRRHRALHDILSGLVVVRTRALTPLSPIWNMPAA
jgi:uncharacterized RDD family membrane protein YckC